MGQEIGRLGEIVHPVPDLVHAYGALKGRPHVVHSVKPLSRLPWGSVLISLREQAGFHKFACLIGQFGNSVSFYNQRPV